MKIVHIQNTRWEDDDAMADDEHFEDVDTMIAKIKKYRAQPH